jgi:hypothetical protein
VDLNGQWPLGPRHDMVWALAQFYGELVYFEWFYIDKYTGETLAKGSCTKARRGHRGAVYYKSEQLTFYRGTGDGCDGRRGRHPRQ